MKEVSPLSMIFKSNRSWQFFPVKSQVVNILGFEGHLLAPTQLSLCRLKVVIRQYIMNGHGYVPIKWYLQKQLTNLVEGLPTHDLVYFHLR